MARVKRAAARRSELQGCTSFDHGGSSQARDLLPGDRTLLRRAQSLGLVTPNTLRRAGLQAEALCSCG
eukprot:4566826-Alexandrium_andersonii.AAC.1